MPKPSDPIFQTQHDAALDALGAKSGGRTWGAFDVSKSEAEKGQAARYVIPLWNFPRKPGQPDSTGKALVRYHDGTWWYHIRRPSAGANTQWKAQWDSLQLSQRQGIPIIGVLKDRDSGLCALDITFDCGPFEGSFDADDVWMQARPRDRRAADLIARHGAAALDPRQAAQLGQQSRALDEASYFNPNDLEDARTRLLREVVQRRGQQAFRHALLAAYGERCAVTGCDAVDALEAAHIVGYYGPATQHVSNGLLLRADIHTLFDLGLLTVCPDTLVVHLAPSLRKSSYESLHGRELALPADAAARPNRAALRTRWRELG